MEKTFKNLELVAISNSLLEFMQIEFPIDNIGWNLKKNMNKIQSAIQLFAEYEQELVSKYAVKVDNKIKYKENGQPEIYPAKQEIFAREHTELLNCESTVDILQIKYSALKDHCNKKGINIKPSLLFNLDFMIEDDTE